MGYGGESSAVPGEVSQQALGLFPVPTQGTVRGREIEQGIIGCRNDVAQARRIPSPARAGERVYSRTDVHCGAGMPRARTSWVGEALGLDERTHADREDVAAKRPTQEATRELRIRRESDHPLSTFAALNLSE